MNLRKIIKLIKENNVYTEHDAYYANYLQKQYPEIYEFLKRNFDFNDEDISKGALALTNVFSNISEDDLLKANIAVNYINRKLKGELPFDDDPEYDHIPEIKFLQKFMDELS